MGETCISDVCTSLYMTVAQYQMNPYDVILASASPRRFDLLTALAVPFRVVVSDAEEALHLPPALFLARMPKVAVDIHDHPTVRAWRKGETCALLHPDAVVIAADTIVVLDGVVLNKPRDEADATAMLTRLSGREHEVYTGMAVFAPQREPLLYVQCSHVQMLPLTATLIASYIASGEPMDKAGAYGIQGLAGRLVTAVTGSLTNVVGLPLSLLVQALAEVGVTCGRTPPQAYAAWRHALPVDLLPEASEL
jgi:septum formation protein